MRATGCIALWGDFSGERLAVSLIGDQFKWPVRSVSGIGDLNRLSQEFGALAVLVHPAMLGMSWREALKSVAEAVPQARVAICHGVDEASSCAEMTDAGAFSTLLLPLVQTEVHHFLGFVWASLPENHTGNGTRRSDRVPVGKRPTLGVLTQSCREV